jgi:hypothetical protein
VVPAQRRPERAAAQPRGGDADSGESWAERLMRQRLAEERLGGDRHDEPRYREPGYGDDRSGSHAWGGERHGGWGASEAEDDNSGRITGLHGGDRWATVRSDDRGRELRVGERRTAVHADESGTELRMEDRWAAVRRDEVRRPDSYREPERPWERGPDSGAYRSRDAQRDRDAEPDREVRGEPTGGWGEPRQGWSGTRPALPAASSEPSASSWMQGWDDRSEPVGERVRSRHGDDGGYQWSGREEEVPPARSPRARGAGYDTGEERWR